MVLMLTKETLLILAKVLGCTLFDLEFNNGHSKG